MGSLYDELLKTDEKRETAAGLTTGTVKANYDKDHPGMVQVEYDMGEQGKSVSGWIPVAMPYAGADFGSCLLPEIGSEVLVGFHMGNWNRPIVIGSLWNKTDAYPAAAVHEKNQVKLFKTKGGCQIRISEEEGKESIAVSTPKGYTVTLNDEKEQISLSDKEGKNQLTLDGKKGAIALTADKKLELKAGGGPSLTMDSSGIKMSGGDISLTADKGVKAKGQTVSVQGTSMELKADASFKLNASGIAELKGSMIKLN